MDKAVELSRMALETDEGNATARLVWVMLAVICLLGAGLVGAGYWLFAKDKTISQAYNRTVQTDDSRLIEAIAEMKTATLTGLAAIADRTAQVRDEMREITRELYRRN